MAQRSVNLLFPNLPQSASTTQNKPKPASLTADKQANRRPRFGASSLHQRDSRSALFEGYTGGDHTPRGHSPNPYNPGYAAAYPNGGHSERHGLGYRAATPNRKGQYSDAVLDELESQNEDQVAGILGKVRTLKHCADGGDAQMTVAIGDEIRESSALADKMNNAFDDARMRVRGTMNRMKIMAERTGVGWRLWLLFFAAVGMLFFYVWLF
ncbi:Protein transport protein BET1 [Metarhizium anisopliae]|nr:Protein transport protein BET1 [Metarhizium anisopliae]